MDAYDEIQAATSGPKNRSRGSSNLPQRSDFSESDDDQFAKSTSNKDLQSSPQPDSQQFKHASDAIQKHFHLQYPPANINTYISLVNILNR
jgi:hypothetical protein